MNYIFLKDEIKSAMKSRDNLRRDILRQVLNEVKNIEVNERREITEADVNAMLKRVLKQTKETLDGSVKANNNESRTNNLTYQVAVLEEYMPKIATGEELEQMIEVIFTFIEEPSIGNIMKELTDKTGGNFDKQYAVQYIKSSYC